MCKLSHDRFTLGKVGETISLIVSVEADVNLDDVVLTRTTSRVRLVPSGKLPSTNFVSDVIDTAVTASACAEDNANLVDTRSTVLSF